MTMKNKFVALATTALVMMAGPTLAFNPNGELMTTSDSAVSNTWQPMVAQDGDGINDVAVTLHGPNFTREQGLAVIREMVMNNKDKFPVSKIAAGTWTDRDAWLTPGTTYLVPVRADVAPVTTAPAQAAQPAGQTVEQLLAGIAGQQQATAAELKSLADTIVDQLVNDVDAVVGRLDAFDVKIEANSDLRPSLEALEALVDSYLKGELTTPVVQSVQALIRDALTGITADITLLQQADIRFDERLTAAETNASTALETANEAKTDAETALAAAEQVAADSERATLVTSNNGLGIMLAIVLLVGLVVLLLARRGKASKKDVAAVSTTVTAFNGRLGQIETDLQAVRKVAEGASTKVDKVHGELVDFKEDVHVMARINVDAVSWDENNLTIEELKQLEAGQEVMWVLHAEGNTYSVNISKTEQGLYQTDVMRNADSEQLADPMAAKRLKTNILAAIADGRLKSHTRPHAIAAE